MYIRSTLHYIYLHFSVKQPLIGERDNFVNYIMSYKYYKYKILRHDETDKWTEGHIEDSIH